MTDMRPAFYISLMVLGWAVSLSLAGDPFARVNDILSNETTLQFYAKCFLDQGPCSGDGRAIKRLLPDFISSSCARCSSRQKQMACKILYTLQQEKYADLWVDFVKKYDPVGQHQTKLQNFRELCLDSFSIAV
ncbi:allergen Tha p 1-like isoform X1 [Nasonia vitripennis]|uniref:Uncharacterized protein n=1 Tax=Nasonia vitripennis TaxID=7425 RepID=A0A7M7LL85_NASVI|nr:allergen Tha p 1-like isoform X1 [Nasonia vitripennis]